MATPMTKTVVGLQPAPRPAAGAKMVLNVGCGPRRARPPHPRFQGPEWREIRLDVDPAVEPDIVCSITDMRPISDGSVDAIWSSHNLEHLHAHEVPAALREFARALRPGGLLMLTLPDLQSAAALIAADRLEAPAYVSPSGPISPLDIIFGHATSIEAGRLFMSHKTGFTARSLHRLVTAAGFSDVSVERGEGFELWASAVRPPHLGA
jgi:SAM-dependent methyltransferase